MRTTILSDSFNVLLKPQQLDKQYRDHILHNLKRKLENTCTHDLGYILEVIEAQCDKPGLVSKTNGCVRFSVTAKMKILKPELDQVHEAIIETIIDYGMICLIGGIMRCCILTPEKDNYETNHSIHVRITAFRFENHQFSCVGEIVDLK